MIPLARSKLSQRAVVRTFFALLVASAGLLSSAAFGDDEAHAPSDNDAAVQQAALRRNQLCQDACTLAEQNQLPEAVFALRQALAIQRQCGGGQQPEAYQMLVQILMWQDRQGDYAGARATAHETQALAGTLFGAADWRTIEANVAAQSYEKAARLSTDDQARLTAAARLDLQAMKLHDEGKDEQALAKAEQVLAVRHELLGRDDMFTSGSLSSVGTYYRGIGKFEKALPFLENSVAVRKQLYGDRHPSTLITLNNLAAVYTDMGDCQRARPILETVAAGYQQQRGADDPETLQARFNLAALDLLQDRLKAAEEILIPLLKQQQTLFGETDLRVARTMDCLANVYLKRTDYAKALPLLTDSLDIYRHLGGDDHPFTADALSDLANLYEQTGDFKQALQCFQQALEIRRKTLGETRPETATALDDLAHLYQSTGDFARAERLYRQALEIENQTVGQQHAKTAKTLAKLGAMYLGMHDFSKAAMYFQQAVDTDLAVLGDSHPDTAQTMVQLADAEKYLNHSDKAEQLYKQALAVLQHTLGADHPQTAICLNALAHLYEGEKKLDLAESMYQEALSALQAKVAESDPNPPLVLSHLARIAFLRGQYEKSQQLSAEAIDQLSRTLNPNHPSLTEVLFVAGLTQLALAKPEQAKSLFDRALAVVDEQVATNAAAQSERQQLALASELRYMLDLFLSLPPGQATTEENYSHVLRWKGAVMARQVRDHRHQDEKTSQLAGQLQEACTRLTVLSLKVPDPSAREAWLKEVYELKQRKESLESEIALADSQGQESDKPTDVGPDEVRAALPSGTALVDVLQSSYFWFANEQGSPVLHHAKRLLAFVVRSDRPIVQIDLGPAEPIDEAVEQWRNNCRFETEIGKESPAAFLRQRLWEPLEGALEGCHTVLFSPDGALSRIPLNVLPGKQPGSFLIEDVAIGIVPVPQMIPEMLRQPAGEIGSDPSMLLIGDVDYDAQPGRTETSTKAEMPKDVFEGGELLTFTPLKSTGAEVRAIGSLFQHRFADGKLETLTKADATEESLRREAPQFKWLLIATHGFFAPPGIGAALAVQDQMLGRENAAGFNCGFLSGLALAGANTPAAPDTDDGILTAFEVSTLDLHHLDLVVLSGCETGLGQIAGGEGAVGLQRAFQVAGAKTTLASLWNVPDQKTSLMMQRFFSNLWDKKMSKLEALREAQLWMMHKADKKSADSDAAEGGTSRQAPYHWAAFVLSGDWR